MAKKNEKKPPVKAGAPAFMATYGDMMTLLMCFFVLMFSMAEVDAEKFKAVMSSFKGSTSVLDGGEQIVGEGMLHKNEGQTVEDIVKQADLEAEIALKDIQK